jgi:TRAP-type C4-dicarboxylate transport system permease small subunit
MTKAGYTEPDNGGFAKILRYTVTGLALFGGVCLVAMMMLTVTDVVLRYVFSAPIRGALDLSKMLLLLTVFSAVPYCAQQRGHVAIDLFVVGLGARANGVIAAFVALPGVLILTILSWQSINAASLASMLGSATNLLLIPFAPFHWLIALSAFLWAVVMVHQAIGDLTGTGHHE